MEQRASSLSVNLSQGRCKVLPPSVHLQTLSLLCPHKTIKKAAFENKLGDEKGKVITLSVNKNCQNLHHFTVQYVWIQTILLPTEHRASPFTGICVKLGETQSSSLDLWSLMKGAATYSSHSYCLVSLLGTGEPVHPGQSNLVKWEKATEETRWWKNAGMILGSRA